MLSGLARFDRENYARVIRGKKTGFHTPVTCGIMKTRSVNISTSRGRKKERERDRGSSMQLRAETCRVSFMIYITQCTSFASTRLP